MGCPCRIVTKTRLNKVSKTFAPNKVKQDPTSQITPPFLHNTSTRTYYMCTHIALGVVHLCCWCRAGLPGSRLHCHPSGSHRWRCSWRSRGRGSRWAGRGGQWSEQRSSRGTCADSGLGRRERGRHTTLVVYLIVVSGLKIDANHVEHTQGKASGILFLKYLSIFFPP